jgi:ribonuclease P/MRP protein subunit RPP40
MSESKDVISGVPQGSVLGPLFFIVYINDLPDCVLESMMAIYADDAKVSYRTVRGQIPLDLQLDLNRIDHWSDIWQIYLAPPKCIAMRFSSRSKEPAQLQLGGTDLVIETEVRDLGVTMCSNLLFRKHICTIVAKAYQKLNLIFRCFQTRSRNFLLKMYMTYVRPLVESSTTVWSPQDKTLIKKVEGVQRVFTKRIPGLREGVSYGDRLAVLNLESLELRRLKTDLCEVYKIRHRLCGLSFSDFFQFSHNVHTRGHSDKLVVPLNRGRISERFFSHRVVEKWNSLSHTVYPS